MLDEKSIETADRWIATIVCTFFPGILILDYIFGKGLFSTPPGTIYEFLLFVVHSAAISFLYIYPVQIGMEVHMGHDVTSNFTSDQIGIITVPVVIMSALTTVVAYIAILAIARRFDLPASHYERLINSVIAYGASLFVWSFLCRPYFKWYRLASQSKPVRKTGKTEAAREARPPSADEAGKS